MSMIRARIERTGILAYALVGAKRYLIMNISDLSPDAKDAIVTYDENGAYVQSRLGTHVVENKKKVTRPDLEFWVHEAVRKASGEQLAKVAMALDLDPVQFIGNDTFQMGCPDEVDGAVHKG